MSLSSLIVQREVATMRQVEEALARQVIYGGDLVTNLLEVAPVDEAVLTKLLAESMQLAPAPAGELPQPDEAVRALVPPELAMQRGIVPVEVRGDRLVLAVAEPLSPELEEQLAFSLGMGIEQRAASTVRVRQAIARIYGVPMERRVERLVARLTGAPPPSAKPGSMPPPLVGVPSVPEPPRPMTDRAGRVGTGTPAFGTAAMPLVRKPALPAPARKDTSAGFPSVRAEVSPPPRPPSVRPPPDSAPPGAGEPRVGLLQRDVAPHLRAARRRRGPVMLAAAKHEAEEATDRDALLDLFFDFSRQFFDYAALFLVHGDIAEGREAFGLGAPREKVLGIGVPLDLPSMMSTVRDKKGTVVAKVGGDGLEGVLLADLQRPRDVEVVFVPLVVRTRTVAILLADCGPVGIDRASVAQVTQFAGHIGRAFERIIVRRKLDGFIAGTKGGAAGRVDAAVVSQKRPVVPSVSLSAPPSAAAAPSARALAAPMGSPSPMAAVTAAATREPSTVPPPKASLRPGPSTAPPPAANIAAMRKLSGRPIPREEPESPSEMQAAAPASLPPDADTLPPPARPLTESSPEIEAVLQDAPEDMRAIFDELAWDAEARVPAPPPSSSMAVAPHLPPSPHGSKTPLPSVIVDLDEDLARLLDRVVEGDPDDSAEGELLRQGERAMQVVMARFPGPVTVDRSRIATMARPPRASDCGPVLRLVARQRKVALPFVLERLTDPDGETRGWAVHLLCELAYPEAIPYLLLRLRDPDASTRMSAALALAAITKSWPREVRDGVLGLAHGVDPRERAAAMFAMSEMRHPALVPELVRALGDGDEVVVVAAHAALAQVTRQDFGGDARPWLKWWEHHSSKHRVEWLIDALNHEVSEIRRAAGEELRTVTKEYFGYASDLPPRDRERAKQRYRDWWVTEGKARFAKKEG